MDGIWHIFSSKFMLVFKIICMTQDLCANVYFLHLFYHAFPEREYVDGYMLLSEFVM